MMFKKRFNKSEKHCVMTLCLMIVALFAAVVAFAAVQGTKHDLSASTGPGPIKATTINEQCVFCHTPHSSARDASGNPIYPLWNHAMSTATYTTWKKQDSSVFPSLLSPSGWGTGSSGDWVGQPDKGARLCLGCHDGTVAIGAVLNTPGRGTTYTGGGAESITMTGGGLLDAQGRLMSASTAYMGIDFSSPGFIKHPFSIQVNDSMISDKQAQCGAGQTAWAIQYPGGGANPGIDSEVQLRPTENIYKGRTDQPHIGVQCRTCHDPHKDNPIGVNRTAFLVRGMPSPGDNTPLCVVCHIPCP